MSAPTKSDPPETIEQFTTFQRFGTVLSSSHLPHNIVHLDTTTATNQQSGSGSDAHANFRGSDVPTDTPSQNDQPSDTQAFLIEPLMWRSRLDADPGIAERAEDKANILRIEGG